MHNDLQGRVFTDHICYGCTTVEFSHAGNLIVAASRDSDAGAVPIWKRVGATVVERSLDIDVEGQVSMKTTQNAQHMGSTASPCAVLFKRRAKADFVI